MEATENGVAIYDPKLAKAEAQKAIVVIQDNTKKFLDGIREEMKKNKDLVEYFKDLRVRNSGDMDKATAVLAAIKGYYKAKEIEYDDLIKIFKAEIKVSDAGYKKFKDFIQGALDKINLEVTNFRAIEKARIDTENAKAKAAADLKAKKEAEKFDKEIKGTRGAERQVLTAQKEAAVETLKASAPVKEQEKAVGGTSFRKVADNEKIQAAIDKADGKIEIAGVRIYKVWEFEIEDSKALPEAYKKEIPSTRL